MQCMFFMVDPQVIGRVTVENLKQGKAYLKVAVKLDKELEALKRKHEKVSFNHIEMKNGAMNNL